MNSDPPSSWMPETLKGRDELVEEACCEVGGGAAGDAANPPFGDRVVSSKVLVGVSRRVSDRQGVDLDDPARRGGLETLGQAFGMSLFRYFAPLDCGAQTTRNKIACRRTAAASS